MLKIAFYFGIKIPELTLAVYGKQTLFNEIPRVLQTLALVQGPTIFIRN
jgi:hypothetical protein